jgi:acyl-CoA synthetase (AMP-forming)/AMP-acid ligase II
VNANPYEDVTLPEMLDTVADRFGSREAVVHGDRRLTYRDLHHQVERLARGLLALGVAPDDKVATSSRFCTPPEPPRSRRAPRSVTGTVCRTAGPSAGAGA